MIEQILLEEHDTREAAEARMGELQKKNPNANHSVIQGKKSQKWHVVRHTSGGMSMAEAADTMSFEDYLSEGKFEEEYQPVLKKFGFKPVRAKGNTHLSSAGSVTLNQHGGWRFNHSSDGTKSGEGSTGIGLDTHLRKM